VKVARRKTDKPVVGLAAWKFAALQTVIVSERRSYRESNDLSPGKAWTTFRLNADG